MVRYKYSISLTHSDVALQWHPNRNGNLMPTMFTAGSERKVWWRCPIAHDHEWQATIKDRAIGGGCPCCNGRSGMRTVVTSNCLATTHPNIAVQWHPTKNGELTPNLVTASSSQKVWWKCPVAEDHEWKININTKRGCPCCSNPIRKIVMSNCLSTTNPELAAQWHTVKNGNLTPNMVTSRSGQKVWWKCPVVDDHEWEATIANRTIRNSSNKGGCPCCSKAVRKVVKSNCLQTTHPELMKEWNFLKNDNLTPDMVSAGSQKKAWWKCVHNHEWNAPINDRKRGQGCPICNASKGESAIAKVLIECNMPFQREMSFISCKNIRPLPFDFIVLTSCGTKAIEYQGEHHYFPISFGGNDEFNFTRTQKTDIIKRNWCQARGIPLLAIPYLNFDNIPKLVKQFIGV